MSRPGRKIVVSTSPGASTVRVLLALAALGGAAAAPGCVTSGEGEKMQADIASLKSRLDDIDKRDKEYKEQVVRLRKVLDEATALLTRNSADVGAKAAKAEQDIAALQGRIEEMAHNVDQQNRQTADQENRLETRLAALEQTQTKIVDKVAPTLPDEFQKVMNLYDKSPEVPEAMWQLSVAFVQLHFCTDARALLNDLVKRYPKSSRAGDAKGELKTIAKLPKSACTS